MRTAKIFYGDVEAGKLTETDDGLYEFRYLPGYVLAYPGQFITFTMPVREMEYIDKRLFAFFEGLIPEGWLLDIAATNWKINTNDRMAFY
jgi:serine/threonine-protein kinase HipA